MSCQTPRLFSTPGDEFKIQPIKDENKNTPEANPATKCADLMSLPANSKEVASKTSHTNIRDCCEGNCPDESVYPEPLELAIST